MRFITNLTVFVVFFVSVLADNLTAGDTDPATIRTQVREYRAQNERAIVAELVKLLAIPNVASDAPNIRKNAALLREMLDRRSIQSRLLQVDGSPPVVYGELVTPGAKKTVVLYMHYDGQPVNRDNWASEPWQPVFREKPNGQGGTIDFSVLKTPLPVEGRIYAHSASDDKSPIVATLVAIDALKSAGVSRSVNVKFFLEGEEEAGSPHLASILEEYKTLLKADVWFMCDGPVHQTRKMQIVYGARGVVGMTMTVFGPLRPLHSGHYGNWAPNPIMLLTHLLTSMRDTSGRILIDGFYDDIAPLTETERQAINSAPNIEARLRDELGLAWNEGNGKRLEELIMQPALNVRGIYSGGRKARNAIQTEATAFLGFRMVPNQTSEKVKVRVERHIREQGFHIVNSKPDIETRKTYPKIVQINWGKGYPPGRTSMDLPVSRALAQVVEEAVGEPIVRLPTSGGSGPIYIFQQALNVPFMLVPMVNHDNNQHAENENLRLQNLWDGIEMYAGLLARLGEVWP
ncbi:MAG: M20/M25/M40 family metallo-hydrolase [bacterium]